MGVIDAADVYLQFWEVATGTIARAPLQLTTNAALTIMPYFDGEFLWLTRVSGTSTVTPLNLATNILGASVALSQNPAGIWSDRNFLWNLASTGSLRRHDLSVATNSETFALAVSTYTGLTGSDDALWTINTVSGNVEKYDQATLTLGPTFTAPSDAVDLHYDGEFLWILTGAPGVQGTIKKYDPTTGTQISSNNIRNYGLLGDAIGITGDGEFLYYVELF